MRLRHPCSVPNAPLHPTLGLWGGVRGLKLRLRGKIPRVKIGALVAFGGTLNTLKPYFGADNCSLMI